jgi:hypothetical protein
MKEVTDNFGVVIAFWLPGFVLLWGLSYSSEDIAKLLAKASGTGSSEVGGFLYVSLVSLSLGMIVSAVRWLIVDQLINCMTTLPVANFANLKNENVLAAFQGVVAAHYQYYQYYSHTLVAIVAAFIVYLIYGKALPPSLVWVAVIVISTALLLASWDAFKKYRQRAAEITA